MTILETYNLGISFGGLKAVEGVNIHVEKGELLGLIGPNGAGKTTMFNMFTGVYVPTEGTVEMQDPQSGEMKTINGLKPHLASRKGISRTFQNIRLFKDLSAIDNLRIAMHKNIRYNLFEAVFRLPRYQKDEQKFYEQASYILDIVGLSDKKEELAKNLPYGEQRKLEIARAIATGAQLIFLDEPAAGMNPSETEELRQLVLRLKDEFGLTVVLIEHDMKFVMGLCERIYVLDFGHIIAEGTPDEIKSNKQVIKAYLGEDVN
ncbi:MAG: ABC transporter ATP-binding protein [Clostridiales bacterium]|nr:ABC transporter ATP-binding protein [Clostridiales bacterium]